jgi:hypothetical protein
MDKILVNKKSIYSLSLIVLVTIFSFIYFQNIQNKQNYQDKVLTSCEMPALEQINFYNEQGIDYIKKYTFISIFPEIDNIKCLGKIEKIDKTNSGLIVVYTYINNLIKNFVIIFFPLILFLVTGVLKTNKILNILLLVNLFVVLYIWTYSIDINLMNFKLYLLFLFYLFIFYKNINFDKNDWEKVVTFLSVVLGVMYNSYDFTKVLHSNEDGYVGEFFKVQNEYSSYIGNLSNSFVWRRLVLFLENIFGSSYLFYFKLLVFIFTVIVIYRLLRLLKVPALASVLVMFAYSPNRVVAGGDVMYGWLEPRTFAYLFFLTGMYYAYKKNLNFSLIAFAVSFLFHFGVSIVNFPIYFYVLYKNFDIKKILKFGILYFISLTPFIYGLIAEQGLKNIKNTTYYISERSPHHLYPFIREDDTIIKFSSPEWSSGIFLFLFIFTLVLIFFGLSRKSEVNEVGMLSIISGLICILNLIIVYIDPFSRYVLLHPFRTFSIFTFFSSIYLIQYIFSLLKEFDLSLKPSINIFIIFVLIFPVYFLDDTKYYYSNLAEYQAAETKYIIKSREPGVLIVNPYGGYRSFWTSFEANYQIPTYLIRKFTPNNLTAMDIYLERLNKLVMFYDGKCGVLDDLPNFLFIDKIEDNPCGNLIYSENNFHLYELQK